MTQLQEEIRRMAEEKNAVILAHYYTRKERLRVFAQQGLERHEVHQ